MDVQVPEKPKPLPALYIARDLGASLSRRSATIGELSFLCLSLSQLVAQDETHPIHSIF